MLWLFRREGLFITLLIEGTTEESSGGEAVAADGANETEAAPAAASPPADKAAGDEPLRPVSAVNQENVVKYRTICLKPNENAFTTRI